MDRKVEWTSRVNGKVGADRRRIMWEMVVRPGLEHAAEWWTAPFAGYVQEFFKSHLVCDLNCWRRGESWGYCS